MSPFHPNIRTTKPNDLDHLEQNVDECFNRICIMKEDNPVERTTDRGGFTPSDKRLCSSGIQELLVIKEEIYPEWGPSQDQKDPEAIRIKEEQEDIWTTQEGEADISKLPLKIVTVKCEDDEEKPQTSQVCGGQREADRETEPAATGLATQIKTETDGRDYGAGNQDQDSEPIPSTAKMTSDSPKTEVSDDWQEPLSDSGSETEKSGSDWEDTRAPESGLDAIHFEETPVSDVDGEKSFHCFDCGKGFHHKKSLQRHMRVKKVDKPFFCDDCGTRFTCKTNLNIHMRVHTGEKPFDCDVCGSRFSRKANLDRHIRVHTGEKPFGCNICNKRFAINKSLKEHMRVHTGEKPFGCDICGKRFNQQGNLASHKRVHTGEKPFGCDICSKRFTNQGGLITHMRAHKGEKPFSCNVCGKIFIDKGSLTSHMRVHTGEKPFVCEVCGKTFTQHGSLMKHMRIHTGEKLFGCDVCNKRFTQHGTLMKHMIVHTGEKPFGCDVCSKRFTQHGSLRKHMKVHSR